MTHMMANVRPGRWESSLMGSCAERGSVLLFETMHRNLFQRIGLRALILAVLLGFAGTSACIVRTRPAHRHSHVKRGHAHGHHKQPKAKNKKYKKAKKYKKQRHRH